MFYLQNIKITDDPGTMAAPRANSNNARGPPVSGGTRKVRCDFTRRSAEEEKKSCQQQ